jgi:hypothetical protein
MPDSDPIGSLDDGRPWKGATFAMLEKLAAALLRRDNFGDLRHALYEISFGHGILQRAGLK